MQQQDVYDAVILGAGASGLMCAMTASGRGRRVLVIDHAVKPGLKFSITGGGKCNLTNTGICPEDYEGENPSFCRSALARFTPAHLLALMREAGVSLEEREHGQIFCRRSAKDALAVFVNACAANGCHMALREKIIGASFLHREHARGTDARRDAGPRFIIHTRQERHSSRSLVIALGGPAWPQTGATGKGYTLARAFGHRIVPIRPALAGLIMPENWPLAGLAGISTKVTLQVTSVSGQATSAGERRNKRAGSGHNPAARDLDLLFTHKGISGPAALQASLYWRKGCGVAIDFLPDRDPEDLLRAPGAGKQLCRTLFRRILPERLCSALIPDTIGAKKTAELSRAERQALVAALTCHVAAPTGTEGFSKAEVTAGGVSTEDISSRNMESRLAPGLFFCGEILDVTGRLGGYNLHWAFASGKAAGEAL